MSCRGIPVQKHLPEMRDIMYMALMLFVLLIPGIYPVHAEGDMASDLICPCECAMVISTCECPTAIQVKKEIARMKDNGFSEKQVFSALQAEYGREILVHPEKTDSVSLWAGGISLVVLFGLLAYLFNKKPKMEIMPEINKYEQRFEEEYREFIEGREEK